MEESRGALLFQKVCHILNIILKVAVMVIIAFPFYWMVSTSLKDYTEALQFPPTLFPSSLHWENYAHVFEIVPIGLYFRNSVVVSLCVLVLQYLIIVPAAYSFARHEYFGKNILFWNCTVRINDPAADHLPSGLPDVQPDEDVKNIYTVNITIYFQSIWYFHAPPVFYADPSGSH